MDLSTSNQDLSPAKKASLAEKIAQDMIGCDPTILSLLVLDEKDGSKVLAVARSPNLPPSEHASPELVRRFGLAAMVVWGAAQSAAQLLGRRQFILGAFKEQLVLVFDVRGYGMLVAARLTRSSNGEHIYDKIADLLGIR